MKQTTSIHTDEDRKKGIIISLVLHALLLLLCLSVYFPKKEEIKEIAGIVVSFGNPEDGSAATSPISESEEQTDENNPESNEKSASPDAEATAPQKEKVVEDAAPAPLPIEDIQPVVDEAPLAVNESAPEKADTKEQDIEKEKAAKAKQAAEKLAREEAAKKAAEEAAKKEYEDSKQQFSDLFGAGKGNNNNDGKQGSQDGDPDSNVLDNLSKGSGRIGGGLTDRSVEYEPIINDNTQRTGKVVVKVCVDKSGKVTESKYTQRGSTTTDKYLIDVAEKGALKYRFSASDVETQCGTITVDFKLK